MTYEEIIELSKNKTSDDSLLRESIRQYVSWHLFTGEHHHQHNLYELDVDIEGTFGLSEAEKIKYLGAFEMEGEGIIYFKVGGIYDDESGIEPTWEEFDDVPTDSLLDIVDYIERN